MNAVDTNVYVYALDADEADKQAKALDLFDQLELQRAETVLIWQVAGEFLNQLRSWESRERLTAAEVEAAFQRARAMFELRIPSEAMFQISFDLRSRHLRQSSRLWRITRPSTSITRGGSPGWGLTPASCRRSTNSSTKLRKARRTSSARS